MKILKRPSRHTPPRNLIFQHHRLPHPFLSIRFWSILVKTLPRQRIRFKCFPAKGPMEPHQLVGNSYRTRLLASLSQIRSPRLLRPLSHFKTLYCYRKEPWQSTLTALLPASRVLCRLSKMRLWTIRRPRPHRMEVISKFRSRKASVPVRNDHDSHTGKTVGLSLHFCG